MKEGKRNYTQGVEVATEEHRGKKSWVSAVTEEKTRRMTTEIWLSVDITLNARERGPKVRGKETFKKVVM